MNTENGFRRAAMIIASLDRQAADELLDRLPDEQAAAIRHQILSLPETDGDERQAVIRDFLHPAEPSRPIEAERNPLKSHAPPRSPSLEDLLCLDNELIASALFHERPSVVAAMLASLPGDRAAMILRLLPTSSQTHIAVLLSHGMGTDPAVIDAIADFICDVYARSQSHPSPGMRHHHALQSILSAMSPQERLEMLRSLEAENPMLARRLADADPSISDCYC